MSALVYESISENAPLVCLGRENSNRLVSLWDLVNQFDVFSFANGGPP